MRVIDFICTRLPIDDFIMNFILIVPLNFLEKEQLLRFCNENNLRLKTDNTNKYIQISSL